MILELTKHHGLGNDFLVAFGLPVADLPALARRLCDRRRSIGADGLLVGDLLDVEADGGSARMVLYNADGSRAEMSGNGIRCFAQAVANREQFLGDMTILTDAGPRFVQLRPTGDPFTIEASVDMGEVRSIDGPADWHSVGAHPDRPVLHLSLGNPHTVVGVDEVGAVDLESLGSLVPQVNLEIVEPGPEPNGITMRVHERGAGITEACGTGACASAWAAASWGLVPARAGEIVVHMDGGDVRVRLDEPDPGRVTLIGPATYVGTVLVDVPDEGSSSGNEQMYR
jgi:diaminopimelate epimerase